MGGVIGGLLGTLFCKLGVKLDDTGGLDVGVEGGGEITELGEDEEGTSESVETEDGRMELGSWSMLIFERAEGVPVLGVGLVAGRLVEGGSSCVRLGLLDVDGGSYEVVGNGGLLEGGGG